jgi:hypothetical protein
MPRLFERLITLKVAGEIYDTETKAEDILKNYRWKANVFSDNSLSIIADHRDRRGKITSVVKLPNIQKASKPDTEYFLI